MDIFLRRPFAVYVAIFFGNPIPFTENVFSAKPSKTPYFIVFHRLEEQNLKRQRNNGSCSGNLCTMTKTVQEIVSRMREKIVTRSSTKDLEIETTELESGMTEITFDKALSTP